MGRVKSVEEILYLTPPSAVISGDPNQRGCGRQKIGVGTAKVFAGGQNFLKKGTS